MTYRVKGLKEVGKMATPTWRKSSRSGHQADCVEVAVTWNDMHAT
jgi:hypothetical protein